MAASPDIVQVFDDAVVLFDKYGIPDYMDMFDAVAFDTPDAGDTQVLDSLQLNLRTVLLHLLTMQGLSVHEHTLTSQVVELADGMLQIVDYEDKATVEATLNGDFPTQELAAELLALVTPYSVEELMAMLETVEDNFTETLRLRMSMPNSEDSEAVESVQKQIQAYIAYKSVVGQDPIYPDRIFAQTAAIGLEYAVYLRLYQADHEGIDLAARTPSDIAKDLVGMAVLSQDGVEAPLVVVRKHLNDLFGDINLVTKINIAVSNLTVEVSHAQA